MSLAKKQISNHPLLEGVIREVEVFGFNVTDQFNSQTFYYNILHTKDGELVNVEPKNKPVWIITNSKKAIVRDANFQPVPNPDYDATIDGSEEFLTMPAYDYFKQLTFNSPSPVNIKTLIETYILMLDTEDQFFNFY